MTVMQDTPDSARGRWVKALLASSAVFTLVFAWHAFWLYRQPFFDDDYTRWLIPSASRSAGDILWQICAPFPGSWGFLERPVIMLFFKGCFALFGGQTLPYFLAKSAVSGGVASLMYLLALTALSRGRPLSRAILLAAGLAPVLLACSEPVLMSMMWLCDMEMLAEFFMIVALCLYVLDLSRNDRAMPILRRSALWLQLLIFVFAFLGFKTKASAKVLPFVLAAHLLLTDRNAFRRFLPLLCALVAVNVPWGMLFGGGMLPEFLRPVFGGAEASPAFFWRPPSLRGLSDLLVGRWDAPLPFRGGQFRPHGLLHVLFPFGLAAVATAAFCAVRYRVQAEGMGDGRRARGGGARLPVLAAVWLVWVIPTMAIYPDTGRQLLSRYLIAALIPAVIGMAWIGGAVLVSPGVPRPLRMAMAALLGFQALAGLHEMYVRKSTDGATLIMIDKVRATLDTTCQNANIVYMVPGYAFWPSANSNSYFRLMTDDPATAAWLDRKAAEERSLYVVVDRRQDVPEWEHIRTISADDDAYGNLMGLARPDLDLHLYRCVKPAAAPPVQ